MERFLRSGGSPFTFLILMVLLIFFFSACAGMTVKKDASPSEKYLAALTEFNSVVKDYNYQYRLQTPAVQADWKKEIDPWIKKCSIALDAWSVAVSEKASTQDKIDAFEEVKTMLMKVLIVEGIKINKGK